MGGLISGLGSLLGGGSNNSQFKPKAADITAGTNTEQINDAYGQAQNGLTQQQQLLQALQGQNGVGNQSSVFNQLQGVANGTGPNPALAQLAQATGQNVQNQAALMAGQRGAGANAGLLARQAAEQGSQIQQNAAGQAATLQAQQQLNALNQLGGIAGQQVGQQVNATTGLNSAAQGEQNQILNALNAQNQNVVSSQNNMNNVSGQLAAQNAKGSSSFLGGALNGLGGAASSLFGGGGDDGNDSLLMDAGDALIGLAHGGMVPGKFSGKLAPHIQAMADIYHPHMMKAASGALVPGKAQVKGDSKKNDTVSAKLSPGEAVIPRSVMQSSDPVGGAAKFVKALIEKGGGESSTKESPEEFKEALKRSISSRKKQ